MLKTLVPESHDHIGAAGAGKFSSVNPASRMDNCSACTAAHILNQLADMTGDCAFTAEQVERHHGYTGKQRKFSLAASLSYIERATGTTTEEAGFMDDPGVAGHYVVFPRVHGEQCTHVMYGEVRADGSRYLYDPQIGRTMTWVEMVQGYTCGAKTFHLKPKESK